MNDMFFFKKWILQTQKALIIFSQGYFPWIPLNSLLCCWETWSLLVVDAFVPRSSQIPGRLQMLCHGAFEKTTHPRPFEDLVTTLPRKLQITPYKMMLWKDNAFLSGWFPAQGEQLLNFRDVTPKDLKFDEQFLWGYFATKQLRPLMLLADVQYHIAKTVYKTQSISWRFSTFNVSY